MLCIDPGPKYSGYVIVFGNEVLEAGKIPSFDILKIPRLKGDIVLIEKIEPRGVAGHNVIDTAIMCGRFYQHFKDLGCVVVFIERREVLKGLKCKNDSEIIKLLKGQYEGKKVTRDAWQALALHHYYEV